MKFNRVWDMPNSKTFKIKYVKDLIKTHLPKNGNVIDPFANDFSIQEIMTSVDYINNDIDPEFKTDFNLDACVFLQKFNNETVDLLLYDPPYSNRQVSECYKKLGKTVTMTDTSAKYWANFKKEIARVMKPNGVVISFGWNSNGIGKTLGFKIKEILLVAHGGHHHDTICVVEAKQEQK